MGALAITGAALAAMILRPSEEDSFIYYRYALHAARGMGLVFNLGEAVEGYSSPLWMAVVVLLAGLHLKLPTVVPALGVLCGAATIAATHRLAARCGLDRFGRRAATATVALSYPFALWARSGLETPFYSLLLTIAATLYVTAELPPSLHSPQPPQPLQPPPAPARGAMRRRRARALGSVALALAALGRPEGLLLAVAVAADLLASRRRPRTSIAGEIEPAPSPVPATALPPTSHSPLAPVADLARWLLPLAAIYGAFLLWRLHTYGALTANTSVKLYPNLVSRSWLQTTGWLRMLGVAPPLLPLAALRWGRMPPPDRRRLRFLYGAAVLLSVGFEFLAGGDYRDGYRFFVPALPLLSVAIWQAAGALWAARTTFRWTTLAPPRWAVLILTLALSGLQFASYMPHTDEWGKLRRVWQDPYSETREFPANIALWLADNAPAGSLVAFGQMGKIPYYLTAHGKEIRFFDTLGLVDRRVADIFRLGPKVAAVLRDLAAGSSLPQAMQLERRRRQAQLAALLLERQPDFIIFETYMHNFSDTAAIMRLPAFARRYHEVAEIPPHERGPLAVEIYARR